MSTEAKREALAAILAEYPGNSCAVQCARIRAALSRFSLTTFEAMRHLDVYDPRARVMQLRNDGLTITTAWGCITTESGNLHRVGMYVLASDATPPSNRKAVGVCETPTAVKNANNTMKSNENRAACHPDTAPIVYVVPVRDPSGFWPLHVKQCPYCNGQHIHGGGNGHMPLWGHRVAHCVVGAPGYILVGVEQ